MENEIIYTIAATQESLAMARELIQDYIAELQEDLSAQHIGQEMAALHQLYGAPNGALILAFLNGQMAPAGCVAIKMQEPGVAEIKRLYVSPAFRGLRLGQGLLVEAISTAKSLGYGKVRLDSLEKLKAAIQLYKANGFYPIDPYWNNPLPGVVYLEKKL